MKGSSTAEKFNARTLHVKYLKKYVRGNKEGIRRKE